MHAYQCSRLSRGTFEEEWRMHFTKLFQDSGKGDEARWLPDQVFARKAKITLYHPQPYYLRRDYHDLEGALRPLGEKEFIVLDRKALNREREQVGIVFHLQRRTGRVRDVGQYHIEGQPFEFYMFGRRSDWGFVSSEPYNIGVLNTEENALEPFIAECPGTNEEQVREYLEHTSALYQSRFERNYLAD